MNQLNHISKKPKSLGKRKRWEQRATSKVAITVPTTDGCSYQPIHVTTSSKATSGFKSNLTKPTNNIDIKSQTKEIVALIKKDRLDSITAYNETLQS